MGIDIVGIDIVGIDIVGIDIVGIDIIMGRHREWNSARASLTKELPIREDT